MTMPLEGTRVIELNRVAPGSFCGMMLGDMGADIIKIDTPISDVGNKSSGPKNDDLWVLSEFTNRNKKSITLNLKNSDAQNILHELVKDIDVLIEGFRPGVTKRLGADYETLCEINPRLIYCSLSGFGQSGPYRDKAAHDLNYLALSGFLSQMGNPSEPPPIPLNVVGDYAGATMHGVVGILLGLIARNLTGRGQHVDVAYLDTTFSLLSAVPGIRNYFVGGANPRRGHNVFSGDYAYYTVYKTGDSKWISVGCMEPWLWDNFCEAIGREDFKVHKMKTEDFQKIAPKESRWVKKEIEAIILGKTRDEWVSIFNDYDVCVGEVKDMSEVVLDEQIRHREMVIGLDDPRVVGGKQPGIAIKLSETPGRVRSRPPAIGEHTESVLRSIGCSKRELENLRKVGAI